MNNNIPSDNNSEVNKLQGMYWTSNLNQVWKLISQQLRENTIGFLLWI